MSSPTATGFLSRVDDFSYQVYSNSDKKFWFRLERDGAEDRITDFFLGSFPRSQSGALLWACYKRLTLTPKPTIVFTDILSSKPASPELVQEAREFYTESGNFVLNEIGLRDVSVRLETTRGKVNLVLTGNATKFSQAFFQ